MGFMFTSPSWTAATLAALAMSYSLPAHISDRMTMAELQPVIAKLKALSKMEIEACFNDVPDEWAISTQDRQAAVAQALLAQDKIEEILKNGNPKLS